MSERPTEADTRQDAAEQQFVDMVRRLCEAARDGRAHLSHEGGATCMGCRAVREGLNFVHLMTVDEDGRTPETEAAPVLELMPGEGAE